MIRISRDIISREGCEMSDSLYEKIQADARYLNLDICAKEVA